MNNRYSVKNSALRFRKMPNKIEKCKRKFYFPCSSTFKSHSNKDRKKNIKKWINVRKSFEITKNSQRVSEEVTTENPKSEILPSSPILKPSIVVNEKVSPILKFSRDKCDTFGKTSPTLKFSLHKIKRISPVIGKQRLSADAPNDTDSKMSLHNELFDCETSTYEIDDPESRGSSNIITEFLTQECTTKELDPRLFQTQQLYYNPPPKKKKPYSKDGLAFALQKALQRKSAQVTFWEHEQEQGSAVDDDLTLCLQIHYRWIEYGIHMFECENVKLKESNICLVLIGFGVSKGICANVRRIKIYFPYLIKYVDYKGSSRLCYYNVSKIINE